MLFQNGGMSLCLPFIIVRVGGAQEKARSQQYLTLRDQGRFAKIITDGPPQAPGER